MVLQTPFVPFPSLSRARPQAEKEEPDAKSAQTLLSSRPTRVNVNCAVAVSVPVRNPGECVCVCVCATLSSSSSLHVALARHFVRDLEKY